MNLRSNERRYGALSIAMHWIMLALLIAVYSCIELREFWPKGSAIREGLKTWHFMLGLTVFVLVWLRLAIRIAGGKPSIEPPPAQWQVSLGHTVHLVLYAFMIGMPLAGWLMLSAADKQIPFFGFELPSLITPNKEWATQIEEWHETGGVVGYWLIGLHTVAALYHHYLRRDDTLKRMLPRLVRRE